MTTTPGSTPSKPQTAERGQSAPVTWPNSADGSRTQWLDYLLYSEDPDEAPTRYHVNVSFFKSTWSCTYGACPGVLINGAETATACCQIGVHFGHGAGTEEDMEDYTKVAGYVDQLTADDWDNYDFVKGGQRWWTEKTWGQRKGHKGYRLPDKTRIVNGGCIFANKGTGSSGKPGCALHHLANRLGVHFSETKPEICWSIPIGRTEEIDEVGGEYVVTLTGSDAKLWGATDNSSLQHVGYWCTETPDVYQGGEMVYQSAHVELTKLLGAREYKELVRQLDAVERIVPMPGETINGGRPLLPLLVQQRADAWASEVKYGGPDAADAAEALERSQDYFTQHNIKPIARRTAQ